MKKIILITLLLAQGLAFAQAAATETIDETSADNELRCRSADGMALLKLSGGTREGISWTEAILTMNEMERVGGIIAEFETTRWEGDEKRIDNSDNFARGLLPSKVPLQTIMEALKRERDDEECHFAVAAMEAPTDVSLRWDGRQMRTTLKQKLQIVQLCNGEFRFRHPQMFHCQGFDSPALKK